MQVIVVEKTGNLVSYGEFGTDGDPKFVEAKLTSQMADAGIDLGGTDPREKLGQKVVGNDGTLYKVTADGMVAVGQVQGFGDRDSGQLVSPNAYADTLKQDILDSYKDSTALIINSKLAELREIDPNAAAVIDAKFASIRTAEAKALAQSEGMGQDFDSIIKNMTIDPSKISQREQELRDTQVYLDNPVEIKPTVNYHTTVIPIVDIISTIALETTVTFLGGSLGTEIQANEYKHYTLEIDHENRLNSSISVETIYFGSGVDKNELQGIGATASYSAGLSFGRFDTIEEGLKTFIGTGKELNALIINIGQSDRNENGNRWTNMSVSDGKGVIFNAGNTYTDIPEELISEKQKTTLKLEQ